MVGGLPGCRHGRHGRRCLPARALRHRGRDGPPEPLPTPSAPTGPVPPSAVATSDDDAERRRGPFERRLVDPDDPERLGRRSTDPAPAKAPQKTAERIERRLRLRVTAGDVDATAQRLWSRSLEAERERRVTDRAGPHRRLAQDHPGPRVTRPRPRDRPRDGAGPRQPVRRRRGRGRGRGGRPGGDEPGGGGLGGHPPQHHPGQQGVQRQRRHPVVELHPAPGARATRPSPRRGGPAEYDGGEPAGRVVARQARHHQRLSTPTSSPTPAVPSGSPGATSCPSGDPAERLAAGEGEGGRVHPAAMDAPTRCRRRAWWPLGLVRLRRLPGGAGPGRVRRSCGTTRRSTGPSPPATGVPGPVGRSPTTPGPAGPEGGGESGGHGHGPGSGGRAGLGGPGLDGQPPGAAGLAPGGGGLRRPGVRGHACRWPCGTGRCCPSPSASACWPWSSPASSPCRVRPTWPRIAATVVVCLCFAATRDAQVWTVGMLAVATGVVAVSPSPSGRPPGCRPPPRGAGRRPGGRGGHQRVGHPGLPPDHPRHRRRPLRAGLPLPGPGGLVRRPRDARGGADRPLGRQTPTPPGGAKVVGISRERPGLRSPGAVDRHRRPTPPTCCGWPPIPGTWSASRCCARSRPSTSPTATWPSTLPPSTPCARR